MRNVYKHKSKLGVSPIVSTVLLTALVVVLGVMVVFWGVTSFGLFGGNIQNYFLLRSEQLQENIIIEHVMFIDKNNLTLFIRNIGSIEAVLETIYILNLNNTQQYAVIYLDTLLPLENRTVYVGKLLRISIQIPDWMWERDVPYQIKVTTSRATSQTALAVSSYIIKVVETETIYLLAGSDPEGVYGNIFGIYNYTHVQDGVYQNITEGVFETSINPIVNGDFQQDASGWLNETTGDAVNGWENTGITGGSIFTSVAGRNKAGTGSWYQTINISNIPKSAILTFNYSIPNCEFIDSFILEVFLRKPDGSQALIWNRSITDPEDWSTVTSNITADITLTGEYTLIFNATISTLNMGKPKGKVFWDDVILTLTYDSYYFDIYYQLVNASGIDPNNITNMEILFYGYVDENVHVAIYNFTSGTWIYLDDIYVTSPTSITIPIESGFQHFIANNGTVKIRFYTDPDFNGVSTIYIDYLTVKIKYIVRGG